MDGIDSVCYVISMKMMKSISNKYFNVIQHINVINKPLRCIDYSRRYCQPSVQTRSSIKKIMFISIV